jgi:hypothetical protein
VGAPLRDNLEYHLALMCMNLRRTAPLTADMMHKSVVITDASWRYLGLPGRMSFLVACPERNAWQGGVIDVEPKHMKCFKDRATQIIAAELLAPLCALKCCRKTLERTAAIFFIDNMSSMCALVTGSCRAEDLASVATSMHVGLMQHRCWAWLEYVESDSNIADGGSRVSVTCPDAAKAGFPMEQYPFLGLPQGFPRSTANQWIDWWHAQE